MLSFDIPDATFNMQCCKGLDNFESQSGFIEMGGEASLTIQALAACLRSKLCVSRCVMTPAFLMTIWAKKAFEPSLRDHSTIDPIFVVSILLLSYSV